MRLEDVIGVFFIIVFVLSSIALPFKHRQMFRHITKTPVRKTALLSCFFIVFLMFLEKKRYFSLYSEDFVLFLVLPFFFSFLTMLGVAEIIYKWVIRKDSKD